MRALSLFVMRAAAIVGAAIFTLGLISAWAKRRASTS